MCCNLFCPVSVQTLASVLWHFHFHIFYSCSLVLVLHFLFYVGIFCNLVVSQIYLICPTIHSVFHTTAPAYIDMFSALFHSDWRIWQHGNFQTPWTGNGQRWMGYILCHAPYTQPRCLATGCLCLEAGYHCWWKRWRDPSMKSQSGSVPTPWLVSI